MILKTTEKVPREMCAPYVKKVSGQRVLARVGYSDHAVATKSTLLVSGKHILGILRGMMIVMIVMTKILSTTAPAALP